MAFELGLGFGGIGALIKTTGAAGGAIREKCWRAGGAHRIQAGDAADFFEGLRQDEAAGGVEEWA